jgi:capsular polysaccharide transport system permease protein
MSSTYIHTKRSTGSYLRILKFLAKLYVFGVVASIAYLWTLTQDRFVSAADFKISRPSSSPVDSSSLIQLALPGLADSGAMDSQIAIGFISSSDLLLKLEKEFDLIAHYSAPRQDVVFRMEPDWPLEERLKFYRKHIFAHYHKDSGLTTLSVETFDPQLSHKIAAEVLKKSETFINELNQSIAEQQLNFIHGEVERAVAHVEGLHAELLKFQNEHKLISPDEVIGSSIAALRELQMEQIRTEGQLATLLRDSPESPKIDAMRSQLRSLRDLIDAETNKLSGPDRDRMNQILLQFKELQMKLEFANRLRSGAEVMLEKNRVETAAHTRFFSVIQNPYLPEDVAAPRRWYLTATILALGLLVFLTLRALTHSVLEHA